jgi:8-oxo-dGTP pyrophosphatase MutT (NUDIX family)
VSRVESRERVVDCGRAVMFLVVCGDEVLLEERPDNEKGFANETIIPGGKNEPGESHLKAVKREIKEETGLVDVNPRPLGDNFKVITTNAHLYLMQAYLVEIGNKTRVVNVDSGSGKHVWVKLAQAREELRWAHSQLILERARLILGERLGVWR